MAEECWIFSKLQNFVPLDTRNHQNSCFFLISWHCRMTYSSNKWDHLLWTQPSQALRKPREAKTSCLSDGSMMPSTTSSAQLTMFCPRANMENKKNRKGTGPRQLSDCLWLLWPRLFFFAPSIYIQTCLFWTRSCKNLLTKKTSCFICSMVSQTMSEHVWNKGKNPQIYQAQIQYLHISAEHD